jgi:ribosomal RNA assembly protein
MLTLKGRVIGTNGKTKKLIENFTETKLAIYGKTICIIGRWDRVVIAKKSIEMLLSGRLHTTVYRFLEKQRR